MKKPFHEKNPLVQDEKINLTFESVLAMTDGEFESWVSLIRKEFVRVWDELGCPPKAGYTEEEMIREFVALGNYDSKLIEYKDELDADSLVLWNTHINKSHVNQWFPHMMKTRIADDSGFERSLYDTLSLAKYEKSFLEGCKKHFKRDSFYVYSKAVRSGESEVFGYDSQNLKDWLLWYSKNKEFQKTHGIWIAEANSNLKNNTGNYQKRVSNVLTIKLQEIYDLGLNKWYYPEMSSVNSQKEYTIRLFSKNIRIFPEGFRAFRIGYTSVPVNFPARIAKYIYEKYTEQVPKDRVAKVYDPSSGWGGRILGAMSANRRLHYIGTDPNSANMFNNQSSYKLLADFYNLKCRQTSLFYPGENTYELYQNGSEVIFDNPDFKKHHGTLDLVFTSPPYFNREVYSQDSTQSCVKYPKYNDWVDGYLKPTLMTCVDYLKVGGYLVWNINNIKIKSGYLTLEKDSVDYLKSLGMVQEKTLKMLLVPMSGADRLDANGQPKFRNFCKVKGRFFKYEPIFVFKKISREEGIRLGILGRSITGSHFNNNW